MALIMAQGRAVFKAWPGLGFVSALALVLERWYGIGSWLVSTAKKNTKKWQRELSDTSIFQVSLKGARDWRCRNDEQGPAVPASALPQPRDRLGIGCWGCPSK